MLDRPEAQARPAPSRGAGQRVGAVQSRGSMCLAARARAVRPRAAPPGRARGQGSAPIVPRCYCHQCGRHPPLHADVRTARRRGRRGRRGTRHGRHRRDGRDGRRRRRGRHNQLPSLRGRSAPRTGQLYHRQTGLTAVASCRSMPCRLRSKRFIFFVFLIEVVYRCTRNFHIINLRERRTF